MSAHTVDQLTTTEWHMTNQALTHQRCAAGDAGMEAVGKLLAAATQGEAEEWGQIVTTFYREWETAKLLLSQHDRLRPHGLRAVR